MYSSIKNVQILIALLKEFDIKRMVLSPGGSDIPLIHSIENDVFFECYSVVDERSAAYFAMGMALERNEIVACVCTSGTAVSNYLPGLTEAYYQNVPVLAITADKNPYFLNNLQTQKIDQHTILDSVCKKNIELLPRINSEEEYWYCERLINEALMELTHHGKGPVQINVPIVESYNIYNCKDLPKVKKMQYVDVESEKSIWEACEKKINDASRILVVVGQDIVFDYEIIKLMELFYKNYNCLFTAEHMSNLNCKGKLNTYPLTEMSDSTMLEGLYPDLVISMGNNVASYNIKPFIRSGKGKIEHWQIDEAGRVRDMFMCLTNVFECSISYFLKYFNETAVYKNKGNEYFHKWEMALEDITIPESEFSSLYVGSKLSEIIPDKSIVHLAILNSTRIMQFFKLQPNVRVYSNLGALGIDGCLSTFMGQAACTEELAFCVIGDLSYFYDMNASGIRHIGNNVRIILLNNGGGSEFQFFMDKKTIPTLDTYICAEHKKNAKAWMESLGYKTFGANTKEELANILPILAEPSDSPVFLEICTEMEMDAKIVKSVYNLNQTNKLTLKSTLKKTGNALLNTNQKEKIKKILSRQ